MSEFEKITYEIIEGICYITMHYPKNLNAIDEQMADELIDAFEMADRNTRVKVVIFCSKAIAFSAGGDIGYFYDLIRQGGEVNMDALVHKVGILIGRIKKMKKLVITKVNGAAAGAGASLAMAGDFVFCAENAKFILAFVNLGLVPDTGALYMLSRKIGDARAMELAVTGRPLAADEAEHLGIVYKTVSQEKLDETVMTFAKKLADGPLLSYGNIKKQIYDAAYADFDVWLKNTEAVTQRECAASEDFKEGCMAFMEKRPPQFGK